MIPNWTALLLRLHTETACRRGGALALRPADLDRPVPDPDCGRRARRGAGSRSRPPVRAVSVLREISPVWVSEGGLEPPCWCDLPDSGKSCRQDTAHRAARAEHIHRPASLRALTVPADSTYPRRHVSVMYRPLPKWRPDSVTVRSSSGVRPLIADERRVPAGQLVDVQPQVLEAE